MSELCLNSSGAGLKSVSASDRLQTGTRQRLSLGEAHQTEKPFRRGLKRPRLKNEGRPELNLPRQYQSPSTPKRTEWAPACRPPTSTPSRLERSPPHMPLQLQAHTSLTSCQGLPWWEMAIAFSELFYELLTATTKNTGSLGANARSMLSPIGTASNQTRISSTVLLLFLQTVRSIGPSAVPLITPGT